MHIYFFGSISGGTKDINKWYRPMIKHIKSKCKVLSEDIFFHPDILDGKEDGVSNLEIFRRDVALIGIADALIGDVSVPSLGVGWEIRHAQSLGKPVLCLHRVNSGKILSPMISGNSKVIVRTYSNLEEAKEHIDQFLEWLKKRTVSKQSLFARIFS